MSVRFRSERLSEPVPVPLPPRVVPVIVMIASSSLSLFSSLFLVVMQAHPLVERNKFYLSPSLFPAAASSSAVLVPWPCTVPALEHHPSLYILKVIL